MGLNLAASLTQVLRLDDPSQVGHARRVAQRLAEQLGFNAADAGRAAIVATELASNVLKHAEHGELHLRVLAHDAHPGMELVAVDRAQGFDLANCLADGYSTGGTQGIGLGRSAAWRRYSMCMRTRRALWYWRASTGRAIRAGTYASA